MHHILKLLMIFYVAIIPLSLLFAFVYSVFFRKSKAKKIISSALLLIFIAFMFTDRYYSGVREIVKLRNFSTIDNIINTELSTLIDQSRPEPLIHYRMKKPAVSSWKMIYCYAKVYHLTDHYTDVINTKWLTEHLNAVTWPSTNADYLTLERHGQCIQPLHTNTSQPIWVAPLIHRFSKEKLDYDDQLMKNSVIDKGSYLVFGKLHPKKSELLSNLVFSPLKRRSV